MSRPNRDDRTARVGGRRSSLLVDLAVQLGLGADREGRLGLTVGVVRVEEAAAAAAAFSIRLKRPPGLAYSLESTLIDVLSNI